MSESQTYYAKLAKKYSKLTDEEKTELLDHFYNEKLYSWSIIAKKCGTYSNKVRRDAIKLGIESRNKSAAQRIALEDGRHTHPTKGKGHSEDTRIRISETIAEQWDDMSPAQRLAKSKEAKQRWNEKTEEEIREFRRASVDAVKATATEGSMLEKYLHQGLIRAGYEVEFHKEQWVVRQKLQIDLYIPKINVAIEVDGPCHFKDIWGVDVLRKNELRDHEKNGLLLQQNSIIIRVRQTKAISEKFKRDTLKQVLSTLEQIKKKRPSQGKRVIVLGE